MVCSVHLRLLAPGVLQCMLHWWRVNRSTARELFPCAQPLTPSTKLGRPQVPASTISSNLRYDPIRNLTQPTSFGGACSTNCATLLVKNLLSCVILWKWIKHILRNCLCQWNYCTIKSKLEIMLGACLPQIHHFQPNIVAGFLVFMDGRFKLNCF